MANLKKVGTELKNASQRPLVLGGIHWCFIAILWAFPLGTSIMGGDGYIAVNLAAPLFWLALCVTGLSCLIYGIKNCKVNGTLWALPLYSSLFTPIFVFTQLDTLIMPYGVYGSVTTKDGQTYDFMSGGFLQGYGEAIGELRLAIGPIRRYRTVARGIGEFAGLQLVRPANSSTDQSLLLTEEQVVVGSHGGKCYVAYDTKKKISYSQLDGHTVLDGKQYRTLSPFVLLHKLDELNKDDVRALLEFSYPEVFDKVLLERELNHPNLAVRQLAARLLEML